MMEKENAYRILAKPDEFLNILFFRLNTTRNCKHNSRFNTEHRTLNDNALNISINFTHNCNARRMHFRKRYCILDRIV